jgi:hypothetical protein
MYQSKRRANVRQQKVAGDSGTESGGSRSADPEEPSLSPEVPTLPLSRRPSSNQDKLKVETYTNASAALPPPPPVQHLSQHPSQHSASTTTTSVATSSAERRDEPAVHANSSSLSAGVRVKRGPSPEESRSSLFKDNELPHIATLSLPDSSPTSTTMPALPPIRPASEQQAAQRKRAATVSGKSSRQSSSTGPKVVACNFCRGWCIMFLKRYVF